MAEAGQATTAVYAPVGKATSVPAGYMQFCEDEPGRLPRGRPGCPRRRALQDGMARPSGGQRSCQPAIEPVTDQDNYGVAELGPIRRMGGATARTMSC